MPRNRKVTGVGANAGGQPSLDPFKQAAVLVLGVMCFVGGFFGEQFIEFLFNVSVDVDFVGYAENVGLFVLSVVAGYFVFKYVVDKHPLFWRLRSLNLNFRWICASIGGFFAMTLVVTKLFSS